MELRNAYKLGMFLALLFGAAHASAVTLTIAKIEGFDSYEPFVVGETRDSTSSVDLSSTPPDYVQGFHFDNSATGVTPTPYITIRVDEVKDDGELMAGLLTIFLEGTSPVASADQLAIKAGRTDGSSANYFANFVASAGQTRVFEALFDVGEIDRAVSNMVITGTVVPLPAAAWLFLTGVAALFGFTRVRRARA